MILVIVIYREKDYSFTVSIGARWIMVPGDNVALAGTCLCFVNNVDYEHVECYH